MTRATLSLILVIVAIGLFGCEQKQPTGGEKTTSTQPASSPAASDTTQEALEKLKQLGEKLKQESVQHARDGLARLDEHAKELKQKLQTAEEQARPAIQKELDDLSARAAQARDMLGKLAGASDDAWDKLRKGIDGALGEFKEAVTSQPATRPANTPPQP